MLKPSGVPIDQMTSGWAANRELAAQAATTPQVLS
jgi:hypothetical protein